MKKLSLFNALISFSVFMLCGVWMTHCGFGDRDLSELNEGRDITYSGDVAPLLGDSCKPCHISESQGNVNFDTLEEAQSRIDGIISATQSGFMPLGGGQALDTGQIEVLELWQSQGFLP